MTTRFSPTLAGAIAITLALVASSTAQLAPRAGSVPANQSKEYILKASKKIDKLIGTEFRKKQMRPLSKATDEQYMRRAYLTAIGRIPSYEEAVSFLDDADPDKRTKLVDTLLASDGYNMHMFNWWADLLRVTDTFQNTSGAPYIKWIKDSIAENRPFNKMVHDLVGATGGGWQNGAVGYYVRDKGMLKDNMANTTRIFLGTRIECAQCHNHPFDSWSQMDFYEMAAFTEGIKGAKEGLARYLADKEDEVEGNDRELRDVARLVRYAVYDFSIADMGKGKIALPKDYKYNDGSPGEYVDAKTLAKMGKSVRGGGRKDGAGDARQDFAGWVTSTDNPRFTKVIANRIWKRVMGIGVFEPVDNFKEVTDSAAGSNPALMNYLEEIMKELNYDLKAFQKVIFNTYAFQLAPNPVQHPDRAVYHFNGRQLKRLSAEQVWDSMLTLKADGIDKRKGNGYGGGAIMFRNRPVLVGQKTMKDLYTEVMAIDSGEGVWDYVKKLRDDIKSDKGGKGKGKMMGGDSMMMSYSAGRQYGQDMRASELSSPMPNGHFLRQFGQSDREVIENASKDSDVTQVLSILNGHVEKNLSSNNGAKVFKTVQAGKTNEEKVERLFLSILSRRPTAAEKELFVAEFKMDPGSAVENGVSALLSTAEFMFIQ